MSISSSSRKKLNVLRDKLKYYRAVRNITGASVNPSTSLIKKVTPLIKSVIKSLPEWLLYNPISGNAYSILGRFLDHKLKQLSGKSAIRYELFEKGIPATFELPDPGDNPEVSIIIPAYNKFDFTRKAVFSILKSTNNTFYEVIIADDNSADDTINAGKIIKNCKVVRNTIGLGFIGNCNLAAKSAKGKYLVFLNNDTVVQQNWMEELIETFSKYADAGMVGSKLIYPDGILQEAGSITFSDGNCWNYGKMSNPDKPEFNYVKESDYVSGASLMIRKDLWEAAGGFDELYAPAYYDDTDLAFAVRKLGFKVYYQPRSVVIHFEGISHGSDLNKGIKRYQTVNRDKFFNKWQEVLINEQCENESQLFLARDRSKSRKIVLFIDHHVPFYDQDAGSRMSFQYLKLLSSMGFRIKFMGDDFLIHEPYTTTLQQMGIEVMHGYEIQLGWQGWLKDNGRHLSYVIVNRPNVALNYIDEIKACTNCPVIYFGHDLHYLRTLRKYNIFKDKKYLKESEKWKKEESKILSAVSIALYPSTIETLMIDKEFKGVKTGILPLNVFENLTNSRLEQFSSSKKDLLFVGGFNHDPNKDAMLWFSREILPVITEKIPGIKLNIVGSNAPKEILELASDQIRIHGFVDDATLRDLYDSCRVVVAPLRYGAGVKGKVIESLYYRTAIVTTTIGVEGIENSRSLITIADDSRAFADAVIELYNNETRLKEIFDLSPEFIRKNYSIDSVMHIMNQIMPV